MLVECGCARGLLIVDCVVRVLLDGFDFVVVVVE